MLSLQGLTLFDGVTALGFVGICGVIFVAFFIKGAIGVGSLTPTVIFTAFIVDPHHAVLLALVVNLVSQAQFVPTAVRYGDWSIARRVFLANFAGAVVGVWIFGQVESAELAVILGLVLGAVAICDMTGIVGKLGETWDVRSPVAIWTLSGLAGLISGVTGAGGLLFLALYLRAVCPDRTTLRGTIMLLSTLVVVWRAIVLSVAGMIDAVLLFEGAILVPLVILGGIAGTHFFKGLSDARFGQFLRYVVLMGAAGLAWRGATQLL